MAKKEQEVVEEKVEQEEVSQEFVEKKKKKGPVKIIINIIVWIVLIFLIASAIIGYVDFQRISENQEPYMVLDEKSYTKDDSNVTVYKNIVYKIVKVENNKGTSIKLKPFFMSDL